MSDCCLTLNKQFLVFKRSWIFIALAHWSISPRINMLPIQSVFLFYFRVFGLNRQWPEHTVYRTRGEDTDQYLNYPDADFSNEDLMSVHKYFTKYQDWTLHPHRRISSVVNLNGLISNNLLIKQLLLIMNNNINKIGFHEGSDWNIYLYWLISV